MFVQLWHQPTRTSTRFPVMLDLSAVAAIGIAEHPNALFVFVEGLWAPFLLFSDNEATPEEFTIRYNYIVSMWKEVRLKRQNPVLQGVRD